MGATRSGSSDPDAGARRRQRWAVVGAGMLGMRTAQRLAQDGHEVVLYEAGDALGGLAAPWQIGDVRWDRHYHVTLLSDARTRAAYEAVGLAEEIEWVETKTGYYGTDGRLTSVSNAFEFLQLPGLSLVDKGRLGLTIVVGSKIRSGRRMERILVERWLSRWSGRTAFRTFWQPLLRAKMGDLYDRASAAFIWATIQRLYAARRSGLKKEMFGYVRGGYATVVDAYARWFDEHGVDVRLRTPVTAVRRAPGGGLDVEAAGTTEQFDRVAVTLAAPLATTICPDLLPGERARLERVQYVGIVCTSLLLKRPLAPYYLTYITDPATPFTAVVEMTSFIDPAEVGGHTLVYLPKYTTTDDPLFAKDDDEVLAELLPYLRSMHPDLREDDVVAHRVSRVGQVFAIPTLGFSSTGPSIATSVPGLYVAGSANLPFSTLNVDDTLSLVDDLLRLGERSQ